MCGGRNKVYNPRPTNKDSQTDPEQVDSHPEEQHSEIEGSGQGDTGTKSGKVRKGK